MSLGLDTLREVGRPRDWIGLRSDDALLLATWIAGLRVKPDELHTGIPVGRVPAVGVGDQGTALGRAYQSACAWRVDAAVRFGVDWWVVECKPGALHGVIGQVLFYRYWWRQVPGYPAVNRWVIVTDLVEPDIVPVCEEYGLSVIEVGEVLEYPRRRRGYRAFPGG